MSAMGPDCHDGHSSSAGPDASGTTMASTEDFYAPPARLYQRLRQFSGYTWDESRPPIHTPNDIWLIHGTRFVSVYSGHNVAYNGGTPSSMVPRLPMRTSTFPIPTPENLSSPPPYPTDSRYSDSTVSPPAISNFASEAVREEPIVARVTYNVFREERNFQIAKSLTSADAKADYIVKPLDFLRLTPLLGDRSAIIVTIYEDPGENDIMRTMNLGPAFYRTEKQGGNFVPVLKDNPDLGPEVSLPYFLDFAIGAAKCLEILHHKHELVHGEIRGDSFHYNAQEKKVKISVFGSGIKYFEHGLYGSTWSYYLSHGLGARNRLLYISPEQTGRMAHEPDTRTDIYSLGIVFWMMLTRKQPFEGENVIDIVQSILRHCIHDVAQIRIDVPQAITDIIQKCTAKTVADRYHSASGLRYDLQAVQQVLANGDLDSLQGWKVGTRDASSLFTLPSEMIGRDAERNVLTEVIEKVASGLAVNPNIVALSRSGTGNAGDSSPFSSFATDSITDTAGDLSSENGSSSFDGLNRVSSPDPKRISTTGISGAADVMSISGFSDNSSRYQPWNRNTGMSTNTLSISESTGTGPGDPLRPLTTDISSNAMSRARVPIKSRRRGHCEVVTIEGAAGLGKSMLVQSVLTEMRKKGYCATGKFDNARRNAFGPLLKVLSSLFKQVWGERNTETPFHQALRACVEPIWHDLHRQLNLPAWILTSVAGSRSSPSPSTTSSLQGSPPVLPAPLVSAGLTVPTLSAAHARRGSSPITSMTSSPTSAPKSVDGSGPASGGKLVRPINVILEVLRLFANHKFLCVCLDDLHFADEESLDLVTQIIGAKIRMVIIMTYRPDELSAERIHSLIHPADCGDDCSRSGPIVTKIRLNPLKPEDTQKYVAQTLRLPEDGVRFLAHVIHSKCAGNPFYMREMLTVCHRKRCITYDFRAGQWTYDTENIYKNFSTDGEFDVLDSSFIIERLKELPAATRAILSWASLLGNSFSFQLICALLNGEFLYKDSKVSEASDSQFSDTPKGSASQESIGDDEADYIYLRYTQPEAIAGLNAAIQASILVPSEDDDRYRFAHDRYVQAAMALKPCNLQKMHFVIARTLHKLNPEPDERIRETIASHLCEAVEIFRQQIPVRRVYRELLCNCAQAAAGNGARPTAAKFYHAAVRLLQDDPWSDEDEDRSYNETLNLYLKAADCSLYVGHHSQVITLVHEVLEHGRTQIEKAPAHVLNSRILLQSGEAIAAFDSLKKCVNALGVELDPNPTFEKCDAEFLALEKRFYNMDCQIIISAAQADPATFSIVGNVLAEALIAAWWSDSVGFYNLTIVTVNTYFRCGYFPEAGIAFVFLGMLAVSYFEKTKLGVELGRIGTELFQRGDPENKLISRGWMMYYKFISHLCEPLSVSASHLHEIVVRDRAERNFITELVASGLAAMAKLALGENCYQLELWCITSCEDITGWEHDMRGGTILLSVRQAARALQGKTTVSSPKEVLSDDSHRMSVYKQSIREGNKNGGRSIIVYETVELFVLVLYGHFHEALEVGKRCVDNIDLLWSARGNRQSLFYYSWALTVATLEKVHDETGKWTPVEVKGFVKSAISEIEALIHKIEVLTAVSDENFKHWLCYMRGLVKELQNHFGDAVRLYEIGVEHSTEFGFPVEEALGQLFLCSLLKRRQAPWLANRCLQECLLLFRNFGAFGVANYLEQHHQALMRRPRNRPRIAHASTQTDTFAESHVNAKYTDTEAGDGHLHQHVHLHQPHHRPTHSRTHSHHLHPSLQPPVSDNMSDSMEPKMNIEDTWRSKGLNREGGTRFPELDIIDLQAILRSSHIISSVLQVEELLRTMCDVILQTCGSATYVGIITKDTSTENWVLTASGSPETMAKAHLPGMPLDSAQNIAENIIHYCTRFREKVWCQDTKSEERVGNFHESWLNLNKNGKAIISIPIQHNDVMLGVVYLEGNPNSFTERNSMVTELLVSQISISYSNALAMKKLEKASAETKSAAEVQKGALAQARAAEQKARESEQKARESEAKARESEAKARDAEEEAKKNVKLAEDAARAKSSFLANVSHELRTPLNGVIGNADLLSRGQLDPEQQEIAESIRVSADLLLAVINDLLDFSRIEAQKMQLHIQPFSPQLLVSEAVRAFRFTHQAKIFVEVIEANSIPHDLSVLGDPVRLHQVLGNLISNSAKFTKQGHITIGAKIKGNNQDGVTLFFWVEDTGIGIEPDVLPHLFQPFSQADNSTSRAHGGSGLGLSICKSLVQSVMGGKIDLESHPGKGTKVWFEINFQKVSMAQSPGEAGHAMGSKPPALQRSDSDYIGSPTDPGLSPLTPTTPAIILSQIPTSEVRVCVAEDNGINQKIASQFLKRLGYVHIDIYGNGKLAIEGLCRMAAQRTPYHLVLMDVQMPIMDGYEATKEIRKMSVREIRDVLIIAMTASAIHGDREKCLEAGMNDYLAKPVKSEILKKKIEAYIRATEAQLQQSALPIRSVAAVLKDSTPISGEAGIFGDAIVEEVHGDENVAVPSSTNTPDAA